MWARNSLIQITGNDALTGFTAPKILWVQEHEPEVYDQVEHILLPKDYIRLLPDWRVRHGSWPAVLGTILFDLQERTWSAEMLSCAGYPGQLAAACYTRDRPSAVWFRLPALRPLDCMPGRR